MKLAVIAPAAPWYADGRQFTCTQCGNCCTGGPGFVWVSPGEIERLAGFLHLSVDETMERYCRRVGQRISLQEFPSPKGEYDCVFLKEQNGRRVCSVYSVRPLQCRTWPFWESNLASPQAWLIAHNRCPGIGRGELLTQKQIEEKRDAKDQDPAPGK